MNTISFGNIPMSRPVGSDNRPVMKQPGLMPQALNNAVGHGGDQVQFGGLRLFGTDNPAETPEPLSPMELFRQDREKEFSEISLHPRFQQSAEEREMMSTLFKQYTRSLEMEMMIETLPDVYRKQLDNTVYVAQHLASHTRRHPQVLEAALRTGSMHSFMDKLLDTSICVAEALGRYSELRDYRETDREAFTEQLMILFGAAIERSWSGVPEHTRHQLLREAATRLNQYDENPFLTPDAFPEWSGANLPGFSRVEWALPEDTHERQELEGVRNDEADNDISPRHTPPPPPQEREPGAQGRVRRGRVVNFVPPNLRWQSDFDTRHD